jgi:hypothetical protein
MPLAVIIFVWLKRCSRRTWYRIRIRLFSIWRFFLSFLVFYGRGPYMIQGSIGLSYQKEKRDECLVDSFDHCWLAFAPAIHLAKIGYFHMTERELPGGQQG